MAGRLEGKVAFITGIARGQGRSHAVRLAEEGADIIGVDRCEVDMPGVEYPLATRADLDETIALVEKTGRRIVADVADIRDRDAMKAVLDRGLAEFGRLDTVVCNAGIMPGGANSDNLEAWDSAVSVLLTGQMLTIELTWPTLVEQGDGGSIIITSSMAALRPMMRTLKGRTMGLLGYSAAKAALMNLARNYASVLGAHRIRVNTIHPTGVRTLMVENEMMAIRAGQLDEQDLLSLVNTIPVELVESSDITDTVVFLASDESKMITGSSIPVDAGATLR